MQSGGCLGSLFGPLLKAAFPLFRNVLKPFAKIVLITLGFTAETSRTDAAIQNKIHALEQ